MRNLNYGQAARVKIASWISKDMLQITPDGHWIWKGSVVKGKAMFRYGGRLSQVHRYLFKSFYSRFQFDGDIRSNCDCKGCLNPLHHYATEFIDTNTNVEYILERDQARLLFQSLEDTINCFGIYDIKDSGKAKEIAPEIADKDLDLMLLRPEPKMVQYKSVKFVQPPERPESNYEDLI